jgi:hypothetical protein
MGAVFPSETLFLRKHTAPHPRRRHSSLLLLLHCVVRMGTYGTLPIIWPIKPFRIMIIIAVQSVKLNSLRKPAPLPFCHTQIQYDLNRGWTRVSRLEASGSSPDLPFLLISWVWVRRSQLGMSANIWPILPAPDEVWWCCWSSRWTSHCHGKRQYYPGPRPFCQSQILMA